LNFNYIRWTADGRSVLGVGLDEKGKWGALLSISAGTGEVKTIARPDEEGSIWYPERGPDGKSVYFIRTKKESQSLIRLDLESGAEKELLSSSQPLGQFWFAPTPDGQKMAVIKGD
jgi:Tol biopolymer transport system component